MSLINIERTIELDVYDHDTTPSVIKAIQLDEGTRAVYAVIQNSRQDYDIGQNAEVKLTVLRPDKTRVQITGQTFGYSGTDGTIYGAKAELSDVALAVKGNLKAQFKITSGEQELRTEIFTINTGEALDAGDGDWAGDLDGHNLDEMAESIETLQTDMAAVNEDVSDLKENLSDVNERLSDVNNTIINSQIDCFELLYGSLTATTTNNGITFNKIGNGTISAKNTATNAAYYTIAYNKPIPEWMVPGEKLTLFVNSTKPTSLRVMLGFYDSESTIIGTWQYIGSDRVITVPTDATIYAMYVQVPNGTVLSDTDKIRIQIYRSLYELPGYYEIDNIHDLINDENRVANELSLGMYSTPASAWEIGGISISSSGYTYSENRHRIRIKDGQRFVLNVGDTIGLSDFTGLSLIYAGKKANGTYVSNTITKARQITERFTDCVVIIYYTTERNMTDTDVFNLSELFYVDRVKQSLNGSGTASGNQFYFKNFVKGTAVRLSATNITNAIICGKNLFRTPHGVTTNERNGVTKTFDENAGTIVVSSEGASGAVVSPDTYSTVNGISWNCMYKFSLPVSVNVCISPNADKDLYLYGNINMQISDGTTTITAYNEPIIFKAQANHEYGIRIYTDAGYNDTVTFKPQIEVGISYPTEFEPFTGVVVDGSGNITGINTPSTSLTDGVIIDSYNITVLSGTTAVNIYYLASKDNDVDYRFYKMNNSAPDYRQPMISFIDDDTTNTTYVQNYHDAMESAGAIGNYAAISKFLSDDSNLKDMLLEYEEEGFGVLLHCYYQYGSSTDYFRPGEDRDIDAIRENMITGRRQLKDFGFVSSDYWVTPYGVNDPDIKAIAKSLGLKAIISTLNNTPNIQGVTDRYEIGRYSIPADNASISGRVAMIKRGMDACIANGGWIIVTTHANEWGDNIPGVTAALTELVSYANSIGMKVVNFQEGYETYFDS